MNSQQDVYTWFLDVTGLSEYEWLAQRHHSIRQAPNGDLLVQNIHTKEVYEAGHFALYSLEELTPSTTISADPPPFELHIRTEEGGKPFVDVAYLQAHAPERTLFQVASNFNCAEVAHPNVKPNNGSFVSKLATDSTQGPAASASGGVSAITRIHAPFYDPNTPSDTWGQTYNRQIELLGHPLVAPHFPVINGKLWFHGTEPTDFSPETILPHIRIGLHRRVRPYFGYRTPPYMEKIENPPSIDQVFVAALNRRAPLPYPEHLLSKTNFLLDAAYQGTYLSSAFCHNPLLVLTLIGGGSFANPPHLIAKSIAKAHKKYAALTPLQKVILPLYPLGGIVQREDFATVLFDAFQAEGLQHLFSIKEV